MGSGGAGENEASLVSSWRSSSREGGVSHGGGRILARC